MPNITPLPSKDCLGSIMPEPTTKDIATTPYPTNGFNA